LQELEKKAEELAKKEQDMKNMQFQGMFIIFPQMKLKRGYKSVTLSVGMALGDLAQW